jgi:hypothetical protein
MDVVLIGVSIVIAILFTLLAFLEIRYLAGRKATGPGMGRRKAGEAEGYRNDTILGDLAVGRRAPESPGAARGRMAKGRTQIGNRLFVMRIQAWEILRSRTPDPTDCAAHYSYAGWGFGARPSKWQKRTRSFYRKSAPGGSCRPCLILPVRKPDEPDQLHGNVGFSRLDGNLSQ